MAVAALDRQGMYADAMRRSMTVCSLADLRNATYPFPLRLTYSQPSGVRTSIAGEGYSLPLLLAGSTGSRSDAGAAFRGRAAPAQHRTGARARQAARHVHRCHASSWPVDDQDGWSMVPLISPLRRCRPAPLPRARFWRRCWPPARGPPMRVVFGSSRSPTRLPPSRRRSQACSRAGSRQGCPWQQGEERRRSRPPMRGAGRRAGSRPVAHLLQGSPRSRSSCAERNSKGR